MIRFWRATDPHHEPIWIGSQRTTRPAAQPAVLVGEQTVMVCSHPDHPFEVNRWRCWYSPEHSWKRGTRANHQWSRHPRRFVIRRDTGQLVAD